MDDQRIPLGYADDRHITLVSGTRGGKGTSIIVPNLCLWPGSCFVIDPKGENATVTAQRRAGGSEYSYGLNQAVYVLDPFNEVQVPSALKARYNPLDAIKPEGDFAIDDAARIAGALFTFQNKNDPFWEEAAHGLLKGLILHVKSDPDFDGHRNLVSVWRLLNEGDWISVAGLRAAGDKNIPSGFDMLWQRMKRNRAFNGIVAGTGEQMIAMADKTRSGVLQTAYTSVRFIDSPAMQRVLEVSDFDMADLKTDARGISIYLTLPQTLMPTHYRWLRLMTDLAVGEMERVKEHPVTGHPTLFVLDEFAGLKRMETIEHAAAQAAGFGVKFLFVLQNLGQLKLEYEGSWETFLGNSGLKLFFQVDDDFTRSYLSRYMGEQEISRQTQSQSETSTTSQSFTAGVSSSTTSGRSTSRGSGTSSGNSYDGFFSLLPSTYQDGRNRSSSTSTSSSTSHSQSSSRTTSTSQAVTGGWSETLHKRPLLHPDEIGRLLARIDDPRHAGYPGILVALIPGRHPLPAHRAKYFEANFFAGFFDPHPNPRYSKPPTLMELADHVARYIARLKADAEAAAEAQRQKALQDAEALRRREERFRRLEQEYEDERRRERREKAIVGGLLVTLATIITIAAGYEAWQHWDFVWPWVKTIAGWIGEAILCLIVVGIVLSFSD